MSRRTTGIDIAVMIIYGFSNLLFVYKYTTRFLPNPNVWILGYPVFLSVLLLLLYGDLHLTISKSKSNVFFSVCVLSFSIFLYLIMSRFDPAQIRVGRYPALHDWLNLLFRGQFPYLSPTRPSGFPFLFLMAIPFYLLGDLGLMQVVAFLVYGLILYSRYRLQIASGYRSLIMLLCAPMFLYEIVTRSDLFSNMVFVILFLFLLETIRRHTSIFCLMTVGFLGGLLLSTRGIVLLVFIFYLGYSLKHTMRNSLILFAGILAGFFSTILPFLLWDVKQFMARGPFAIQASYLPAGLLVLAIFACVFLSTRLKSLNGVYMYTAFALFAVVFLAFAISVSTNGWTAAIFQDRFDISYFCFCLPFLLLLPRFGRACEAGETWAVHRSDS